MPQKSKLSETIKMLRKERWLTQKEVATAVNLTRVAYAAIEGGRNKPKLDVMERLASFYNLSVDQILNPVSGILV